MHLNIHSLQLHIDELQTFLNIIALCEMKLLLYGIVVWGKKKFCMTTYNDSPPVIGPLAHTPLFFMLKILNIFDIYKLQLGKLVHQSVNVIGPAQVIKFNLLNYIAVIPNNNNTRYAKHGNFYVSSNRTTRFGLKGVKIEGAKLWENIPNNI